MTSPRKLIAFFGASGGCGYATLSRALEAGHDCIALCRTPSKLTEKVPKTPNAELHVIEGNAHEVNDVRKCLVDPTDPRRRVDTVVFSIGGTFLIKERKFSDPHVCENGIDTLLTALTATRLQDDCSGWKPRIVVVSTTGISKAGSDAPCLVMPMYHYLFRTPHDDKKKMEDRILASQEQWTIIRPSLLVDGSEPEKPQKQAKNIRVGIEDPAKGVENKEVGYAISRDDVGRWIFENTIQVPPTQYSHKFVSLTW